MQQTKKPDADFGLEDLQARVVRRVDRAVRWKEAREVGETVGTWLAAVRSGLYFGATSGTNADSRRSGASPDRRSSLRWLMNRPSDHLLGIGRPSHLYLAARDFF